MADTVARAMLPSLSLVFVGDIMLARTSGDAVARGVDPFAAFAEVLRTSDLSIGNLEGVIATVGEAAQKEFNFRFDPQVIPFLTPYFDALSVANNHSGDFGSHAFCEQLDLLDRHELPYFGGGRNLAEAYRALVLERSGVRVAFVGFTEVEPRVFEAGASTPGLAWSDEARAHEAIRDAVATHGATIVVVYMHWGIEYDILPSPRQQQFGRLLIDAGAHLVVGGHPHVPQTVERYRHGLIAYSLGNFVFDEFLDVPAELGEAVRRGWVLRVSLGPTGVVDWDFLVSRTDDQGIPRPVAD